MSANVSPTPAKSGRHWQRGTGGPIGLPITEPPPPPSTRGRDAFFRRALALADLAAGTVSPAITIVLFAGERPRAIAIAVPPALVVLAKLAGLYDRDELLIRKATTLDEAPVLLALSSLVALLVDVAGPISSGGRLTSLELLVFWATLLTTLGVFRAVARRLGLRATPTERCLVVGDADASALLSARMASSPHMNTSVVGYVALRGRVRREDPAPLGTLEELGTLVRRHNIDRVVVAARDTNTQPILDLVRAVKALGVKVSLIPRLLEVVGSSVAFDDVDGLMVLGLPRFGLTRSSLIVKRALDLAGALVLLSLASPLLAIAALAIKLDSHGPVLFRQRRVGRGGDVFEIWKLRTMVVDAEARKDALRDRNETEGLFKIARDPRITRVGRWLRSSSLDELPQLLNVVRGEMSLVGPRPLVLDEDRRVEGWHRRRLHIKPGMTGPWQILGSGRVPLYEMVKIDYLYIANWSLWLDLKLLLRTIAHVLARRGL